MTSDMNGIAFVGVVFASVAVLLARIESVGTRMLSGLLCLAAVWVSMMGLALEPRLGYQAGLACVAVVLVLALPLSTGWSVGLAAGLTALAAPLASHLAFQQTEPLRRSVAELRDQHPVIDLGPRLTGERVPEDEPTPLARDRADWLEEQVGPRSQPERRQWRVEALHRLHDETTTRFAAAGGFGNERMLRGQIMIPLEHYLEYESTPVPQPSRPEYVPDTESGAVPTAAGHESLHEVSLRDFLDPVRMGVVRGDRHALGFLAHRFSKVPDPDRWALTRLELIGLLLADEPVVYESETLPDLAKLATYPTRPLDAFEHQSLAPIRAGTDVVVARVGGRPRMIGALRAADSCLACHHVPHGSLLGAFSYTFEPETGSGRDD